VDRNYTYHVDRAKFDLMLLRHAEELGATINEGARVLSVKFSDTAGFHTVLTVSNNRSSEKTGRLIVDASGRHTFLGNRLKLKMTDPIFDQYAIHTWFEGFDRQAISGEKKDYIYIHFLPVTNSWVWQIPITEEITSIGVVTQKRNFSRSKVSREQFFWDSVGARQDLEEALRKATQLRPFTTEGDYSYAMKQIAGDGWLLIGDAARFVDPIFSSGVSIALNSARFASQDIIEAFKINNFSRASFRRYETIQNRGAKNWYEFITLYYRLNVLFTAFINHPDYRLEVLKLLQGDVYDEDAPPVLKEMRRIVTTVESNPNHLWHKLLGNLTANTFKPAEVE
jgi:FADH2 O2-dependent halogenase